MASVPASEDFVLVTRWVFSVWWLLFLGVHVVTCGYNTAFAVAYSELPGTTLSSDMAFYHLGMSSENYELIAVVHAAMALMHGLAILLMLGGSLWLKTLAFTPWSSLNNAANSVQRPATISKHEERTSSLLHRVAAQLTDRYGFLGVNGKHFHVFFTCREGIETIFQTFQAYRMSLHLPSMLLNRFYVVALVLNCWSSVIIYTFLFRNDEARKRFTSIACDCVLNLIACMGMVLIVVFKYAPQYDPETKTFGVNPWYNDVWAAQALNDFQLVVVTSGWDLLGRLIFSLGLLVTTSNMKELLCCVEYLSHTKIAAQKMPTVKVKLREDGVEVFESVNLKIPSSKVSPQVPPSKVKALSARGRFWRAAMRGVHLLFFMWGFLVLGLHIQSSGQPSLKQCTLQVRPWAVSQPSCFLLCLDCYRLGITGQIHEVDASWQEFDGSTVFILLIKHCPSLDVPDVFNEFHRLISIKIYNTTIVQWRESAAFTDTNHPGLLSLMMARVNMTDGLMPLGFQSADTPQQLYDFEWCITNLRELPDDLDSKWLPGGYIIIEYSQLEEVPSVIIKLTPAGYFSLGGNPISELPPELFEIEGLQQIGVGDTKIQQLPHEVTRLSSTLTAIFVTNTNVSYFWSWTDAILQRTSLVAGYLPIYAGGSAYCSELEMIANGSSNNFGVPYSPEYSSQLMDPTKAKSDGGEIWLSVDCSPELSGFTGPVYPLDAEDRRNALNYSALKT